MAAPGPIILHAPQVRRFDGKAYLSAAIENFPRADTLWYAAPAEYAPQMELAGSDAFVLGLLPAAMETAQDIVVEGLVSERLFYNLTQYYMALLSQVLPQLVPIRLLPNRLAVPEPPAGRAVAVGFSGGIDSFAALAEHVADRVPPSYRASCIVFNNVGSHGLGQRGQSQFERRRLRLQGLADELDLRLIPVDSNVRELISGPFQRTHTLRTLSAAQALQGTIAVYVFASSYDYGKSHAGASRDIASMDPMSVHLLSTEATECVLAGSQLTRVAKTERVAQFAPSYRYLDVCVATDADQQANRPNCSRCWKCARTMLTLDLLGVLDRYSVVFDIDDWRRHRTRRIGRVLSRRVEHGGVMIREVMELAEQQGVSIPTAARVAGLATGLARKGAHSKRGRRILRAVRRRTDPPGRSVSG